jgi:CheY-like chemotaxis protein
MKTMPTMNADLGERAWLRAVPRTLATMYPVLRAQHALLKAPKNRREPDPVGAEEDEASSPSPETQQVIVLVAEDEETIAETLAMIVEDSGYLPVVARNGREALALSRQHRPQLIITDLMMPFLSGQDFLVGARADAAAQGTQPPAVMVVTAASRARAEEAGADAVIVKPFDINKLEAVMERLLQERR